MKLVVQELEVHAPAQVLYELLTDPALFVQWMADDATLDPRPGGVVRWTHANGDTCSGEYVELVPARRVVFTYGWERADVEIPPGSTSVEIDLTATTATSTVLRLVHRGLDDLAAGAHSRRMDALSRPAPPPRSRARTSGPIRSRPSAFPHLPSCADERGDASR